MNTYSFVISHDDLLEARINTTEPFSGLFITKLPSFDTELGYEVRGTELIVKYEEVDGERLLLTTGSYYSQETPLPTIYGIVLKLHGLRTLRVGNNPVVVADVHVNSPDDFYVTRRNAGGLVENHPVKGDVFTYKEGFGYTTLTESAIDDLYRKYVHLGHGAFIPGCYLVRFGSVVDNGSVLYVPLAWLFHDPLVAQAHFPTIDADLWKMKADMFSLNYDGGE